MYKIEARSVDSRRVTNSILGDFIRDAKEDQNFPPDILSFDNLESYLIKKNACFEALEAAQKSWKHYKRDIFQEKKLDYLKEYSLKERFKMQNENKFLYFLLEKVELEQCLFSALIASENITMG